MLKRLRILLLGLGLFCPGLQLAGQPQADELANGIAMITSHTAGVTLTSPGARSRAAELHAVETLADLQVTSGSGDSIFFALSNGIGLGIYENSQVNFEYYRQRPFPAGKESLEYEATRSKMKVKLLAGSLVFSAPHLSPLSEMVIQLPQGTVRFHRASGRVHYDASGAHISITSGIVTYTYPDSPEEVFIHAPNQVRISDQSAQMARITGSDPLADDPASEVTRQLVGAVRHASQRVVFRVTSAGAAIPQPVLVAKPATLQQPSPRPYRYLD